MADVTGPIFSLPGSRHVVPTGTMCDDHPERPATHRVQGETDSFGSEMNDMCEECFADMRRELAAEQEPYPCDYCKRPATDRRPIRDPDEGLSGPVYYACGECRRKQIERNRQEFEEEWGDLGYDDDDE